MKTLSIILIVAGGLLYCSIGRANVIYVDYAADGDGAVTCAPYTWNGSTPNASADITGDQNWGPGHINGNIHTDLATDPTLTLNSAIANDTGSAWTAYNVNVYMSSDFTLSGANVILPADWTVNIVQPVAVVSDHGSYEGQLQMSGATPVPIGNGVNFTYTLSFSGYASFTFCQEMVPVPEPGTFGFLAAGVLLLGGFLIVSRRKSHS